MNDSDRRLIASICRASARSSDRYFETLATMARESRDQFWFTRNDGNGDVPEHNLTWRIAEVIEDLGFAPFFEVGSLVRDGSIDVVGVNRKRGVTFLCEAKLLYGGGSRAKNLRDDVERLSRIDRDQLKRRGLPSKVVRMVVATTWTFDSKNRKRADVVARWRSHTSRPSPRYSDRHLDRLLRCLDENLATFASRESDWFVEEEGHSRQHILTAVW